MFLAWTDILPPQDFLRTQRSPSQRITLVYFTSHLASATGVMTDRSAFVPAASSSLFVGSAVASSARSAVSGRSAHAARARRVSPRMVVYNVEIDFHGTKHLIPIDENQTLLEGIENVGLEVPYSCRAGVCTTCAAKIIEGEVDLGDIALMSGLKEDGFVLTCSGMPRGEGIKLEMNKFSEVYEQQYGQYEK